jgi:hypothetical protein
MTNPSLREYNPGRRDRPLLLAQEVLDKLSSAERQERILALEIALKVASQPVPSDDAA